MHIGASELLFYSTLFNLVGAGVAGATALFVYRRYAANPIFLFWAQGFLYSLLVLTSELATVKVGRAAWMLGVEGALLAAAIWACVRIGDHFDHRAFATRRTLFGLWFPLRLPPTPSSRNSE